MHVNIFVLIKPASAPTQKKKLEREVCIYVPDGDNVGRKLTGVGHMREMGVGGGRGGDCLINCYLLVDGYVVRGGIPSYHEEGAVDSTRWSFSLVAG